MHLVKARIVQGVQDLPAMRAFYADFFGSEPVVDQPDWVEFEVGNIRFALTNGQAPPGLSLAFKASDFRKTLQTFERAGIKHESIRVGQHESLLDVKDPEGIIHTIYGSTD